MTRANEEGFYFWLGLEAEDLHYGWRVNWKKEHNDTAERNEQDSDDGI